MLQCREEGSRVVVFCNTKRRVDVCQRNFAEFGCVAVHGDKTQQERDKALRQFVANEKPLLVATDVRGTSSALILSCCWPTCHLMMLREGLKV
jgi:superfamily II DNA/RNA helicase